MVEAPQEEIMSQIDHQRIAAVKFLGELGYEWRDNTWQICPTDRAAVARALSACEMSVASDSATRPVNLKMTTEHAAFGLPYRCPSPELVALTRHETSRTNTKDDA